MDPFLNNNGNNNRNNNREQNLGAQALENMPSFEDHMERATKDAETERHERNRIHNLASGLMSFSEIKDSELLERGEKALDEVRPILTLLNMVALSSERGEAIEFPVIASEDFFKAAEGTSDRKSVV